MRDVADQIRRWIGRGDRIAIATVLDTRRSAPRPPGSKMAVNDRGEVFGSVSGGCVEGAIVEVAQEVLAGAPPRLCTFGIADDQAWDVGLPCGGEIDVWVQPFDPAGVQATFAELAGVGGRAVLVTVLSGPHADEQILLDADGSTEGRIGDSELEARAQAAAQELIWAERSERREELFIDVVAPEPRLLIFGAVQYARYLSQYARIAGWRPYVIDPRAQFASADRFPDAIEVIASWPRDAIQRLGGLDRATYLAVLTHDPKIDDDVLLQALADEPAYIGAMGSRRTQAKRRERLLAHGVDEDDLRRISAPIGLDLGAVGAEEVAISIMAELLAVRHGHDGGRLSQVHAGERSRVHR